MRRKQEVHLSCLMNGMSILVDLYHQTSYRFHALTLISFHFVLFNLFLNRNSSTEQKTSQIFYQPDSDDDFDEEDPDEDLNI